ncbi:sensor histidine kinase [Falsirhodobacter sp. 1013]|uniref:sensor histidine kinase n=1 Tax=Falsirhodobacter sp. 1013 TaxID=3417566 RepID=UPI003EBC8E78
MPSDIPDTRPQDAAVVEPELGARVEDELAWRLRQQEILSAFGLFALRCRERPDLLGEATRACADGMNVDLCKYLERDREDPSRLLVCAGVGWKDGVVGVATLGGDMDSPAGYAFHTRQPVISNHLDKETRFRTPALMVEHGVRRALNVPVRDGAEPYGVLEVDSTRDGKFSHDDIAFVQAMGNTVAVALERLRTAEELERAVDRERLLAHEMKHRIKNLFSVVSGVISMSEREARRSGEPDNALAMARERIGALERAADIGLHHPDDDRLVVRNLNPIALTRSVLSPYGDRVIVDGDAGILEGSFSTPLALVLHELATNSIKYGAFSSGQGVITVRWSRTESQMTMTWTERGGPAVSSVPEHAGFGTMLVSGIISASGGAMVTDWLPTGLRVTVELPLTSSL